MKQHPTHYVNEEGDEVQLPTKWAICGNCHGNGTHVNRAIDGHGLDPHDPDLDEEFWEMYTSGGYDVRCDAGCDNGKIRAIDEDNCSPEELTAYYEYLAEIRQWDRADRMERMMGA